MDILSREDMEKLNFTFRGKSSSPLVAALAKLEVGAGVKLNKDEWNYKTGISAYVGSTFRSQSDKKFSTKSLPDDSGWIITRIK